MRRAKSFPIVLALLILTGNLAWAAPIAVLNPSFEAQSLTIQEFTVGVLTDWNAPGAQGAFRPSAFQFNGGNPQGLQTDPAVGIPDGVNVAYSNGGTISQVLGDTLTAGLLYTLMVDVGSRLDLPSPGYVVQLLAGGEVLDSTSAPTPVIGQFVTATVSFLAPANHPDLGKPLEIRLLTDGQQNDFDNVRLDAISEVPSIPGGGSAKTDCMLEWLVNNPNNPLDKKGFPSMKQSCMDGDPSCDFDSTAGQCTFHMAACLNVDDPRLVDKHGQQVCRPSEIAKIDVTKADPLQEPLVALGGQAGRQCTKGKKGESCQANADCDTVLGSGNGMCQGEFVVFDPPVDTQSCTELVSIVVPLKTSTKGGFKKATMTLQAKAVASLLAGEKKALTDLDKVQLICLPGEP